MHGTVIEPLNTREKIGEVRALASTTGMEEEEIDEMMEKDEILLVKRKEGIIGFIAFRYCEATFSVEITGLAITQDQRRKGFASLLLKYAEKFTLVQKSRKLIVKTSNDNIPALALYQENGFTIREVELGSMTAHHGGKELLGWRNIPVRDEITLEKNMT